MTKIKIFEVDARSSNHNELEDWVNEWIRAGKRKYDETGKGLRMVINVSTSGYTTHMVTGSFPDPGKMEYTDHLVCTVLYEEVE